MDPMPNVIVHQPAGFVRPDFEGDLTQVDLGFPAGLGNSYTPPGLECLINVGMFQVKQETELLEACCGCETNNKYRIMNDQKQQIFRAKEDTDCCTRNCCGSYRPFDMVIKDMNDQEIIHFKRPLACSACCFPCCLQSLRVYSPPGNFIGSIQQKWSIFYPNFDIQDGDGNIVLRIEGPLCKCSCCGDVKFTVFSAQDGTKVGKVSKKWSGLVKESFTDADNFGITFPKDLDVKIKAVLIGACMLIDLMYFEDSESNAGKVCSLLKICA